MFRRLAVVIRAWTTRRLLWLWAFAYGCVMTSGYLSPISPNDTYFECPRFLLPTHTFNPATTLIGLGQQSGSVSLLGHRALIVGPGAGSYLEALRESLDEPRALESVFVGDYHNPVKFHRLCQELPGIRVWHLELNEGRIASTIFLILATLTLGGAVVQQSQALFSLPHVRMFPRYALPNLIVPLAIAVAGILAASFLARSFGADFWATASAQLLAWGTWIAFAFHVVSLPTMPWRLRRATQTASDPPATTERFGAWSGLVVVLALVACCATLLAQPYILESFLLGELPWLSAAFLLVGGALAVAALLRGSTLCVFMNETGATPILSMQDIEKRRARHGVLAMQFERRLSHLRRRRRTPLWLWHIRAMQFGNPNLLVPVLLRIVLPVAAVAYCQRFFPAPFQPFATVFVVLFLGCGWFVALSHTFSTWWQRRKTFAVQLLYPWTRPQMTWAAFAAFTFDTIGILALLFATFVACNALLDWNLRLYVMLFAALGIAVAAVILAMGGLWLLTLRYWLLAGFLALIGVMVLIFALILAGTLVRSGADVGRVALPFALVAWLLWLAAWRRWMRSEWGTLGS